jgi:fatty acid kinase fatty acid binding subunit
VIGVCTDSNAQLPLTVARKLDVEIVPLSVTVDGVDHLEGVDLDADTFYAHFEGDGRPAVSTAAPGPGRFVRAYEQLIGRGATEIVSVHIGSAVSGTCNAARVAARDLAIPVHVVDTGAASFVVACATIEAANALAAGGSVDDAVARALETAASAGNVFCVNALDLARRGGRLARDADADAVDRTDRVPVLSMRGGEMRPIGDAATIDEAVALMRDDIVRDATRRRVAVGVSDKTSFAIGDALAAALGGVAGIADVMRYRVGPSVGVHTGPGTAGAVYYELSD